MIFHDPEFIFSSSVLKTWQLTYPEAEILFEHHFVELGDAILFLNGGLSEENDLFICYLSYNDQ
jgi:hypothetical protein